MFIINGHKVHPSIITQKKKKKVKIVLFLKIKLRRENYSPMMKKEKKKKKASLLTFTLVLGSQWNKKFICYNCIKFNIFGSILKDFFYTNFTDNKIVVQKRFHRLQNCGIKVVWVSLTLSTFYSKTTTTRKASSFFIRNIVASSNQL